MKKLLIALSLLSLIQASSACVQIIAQWDVQDEGALIEPGDKWITGNKDRVYISISPATEAIMGTQWELQDPDESSVVPQHIGSPMNPDNLTYDGAAFVVSETIYAGACIPQSTESKANNQ